MRYRMLDVNGDYSFGRGSGNFFVDVPEAPAQLVQTRLNLWEGEWFLDNTEGTPWTQKVVGKSQKAVYDLAIQQRIQQTQDVTKLVSYESTLSGTRQLQVTAEINTSFGSTPVST